MPSALLRTRATIFLVTNACAAITLGLAVHVLLQGIFYPAHTAPPLVTALFHLVSITIMALTSRVSIEVVWLSIICAMWLAVGLVNRYVFICSHPLCARLQVITAFAFFNVILLLGYIITLVVVAVKANQTGRKVWMCDVKEILRAHGPANNGRGNINPPNATVAILYPPVTNPNYNTPHYNVPPATPQFQPYYQQQQGLPRA